MQSETGTCSQKQEHTVRNRNMQSETGTYSQKRACILNFFASTNTLAMFIMETMF